jgi:serine/threonine protein kinase
MEFTGQKHIDYINLLYGDIITCYKKFINRSNSLEDYKLIAPVGQGTNGKVLLVIKQKKLYAMKVINKYKVVKENIIRYIRFEKFLLENMNNNFLIKLSDHFQTKSNLYLIMDYKKTDLFILFKHLKTLPESLVAFFSICIAVGIQCLHDYKFAYRDLKPENILIDNDGYPLLCDFGLCCLLYPSHNAYTMCGTPEFFAPEVIVSNSYNERVDWWSMGILM